MIQRTPTVTDRDEELSTSPFLALDCQVIALEGRKRHAVQLALAAAVALSQRFWWIDEVAPEKKEHT